MELERLRKIAQQQYEMSQGIDRKHMKIPQHIEFKTANFEVSDLQKLIKQTTDDLEEADKKRREDFKKYEMEKKFEKDMRLKAINDTQERKEVQEEMEKMEAKHRQHEKLNHPMTKDQLEEVWEEQDHMDPQDWNPKTFFNMHDLDGNGQWDENEVKILFKKELDKAYDPNAPEDDMREREEEMERMREHVFKESDTNKDSLISYDEFLAETQREEYEKDPGWETLDEDENELYTDEEFQNFEHEREAEVQKMMAAGQLPPGYGAYPNIPAMPPVGYGHHPAMGAMGGPQYVPQYAPGPPMPGVDRNGVPMHGSVPGQPANPNFVPGQVPPQQFAGQPQQFAGQPQQFAGQPQQFGQPPQFAGQQQQMAGQPVVGQPQQMGGQPQPVGGQPQQMGGQPQQMRGQPQPMGGQPQPIGGQPQPVGGQPIGGQQQPIAGQPVNVQPQQGGGQPNQKP